MTAIIASSTSDELLRDAELEATDSGDVDAETLDEVVERVKSGYAVDAEERVRNITERYERKLMEVKANEQNVIANAEGRGSNYR